MTTRLEVRDPTGRPALRVAAGEVRLLADDETTTVLPTLLGRGPAGWQLRIDGRAVRARTPAGRVRRGLAVVGGAPVAPDVTVTDHLAAIAGWAGAARLLAATPLLDGRGGDPAGVLSGGERRVLAWVRARALQPAAVLLDGAAEGLDPDTLRWAGRQVDAWRRDGAAIVVRAVRAEERAWAGGAARPTSPP